MKRMWSKKELNNIADSRVQALVEGGTLDNAKPIYCHPIYWTVTDNSEDIQLTCLIFNNSETPFTVETFIDYVLYLYSLVESRVSIMASGGKDVAGVVAPLSRITCPNGVNLYFTAKGVTSVGHAKEGLLSGTSTFEDGFNKIN